MSQIVQKLSKKEEFTSKFGWMIAGAGFHLESDPNFTLHQKKEQKCKKNNHNNKHVVSSSGNVYFVVSTHTYTHTYISKHQHVLKFTFNHAKVKSEQKKNSHNKLVKKRRKKCVGKKS